MSSSVGEVSWEKSNDGLWSPEPVVLNARRRFWRWVLGYTEPLYTRGMALEIARNARPQVVKEEIQIFGTKRIQIVEARNGKIIRYTPDVYEDEVTSAIHPSARLVKAQQNEEQYYLVPEGNSLIDAIAVVMALDRVK